MARPKKIGLDYFPFDVDFFDDDKIAAVFVSFGIKGEITCVKLLCAIYRNGYFIEWRESVRIKLLKSLPGVSESLLQQIVECLVKWGFFDKSLFDSAHILTSAGIQRRYFSSRRVKPDANYPYIIFAAKTPVSATKTPVSATKTQVSATEIKEKEAKRNIKEKEKKRENSLSISTAKTNFADGERESDDIDYKNFASCFNYYLDQANSRITHVSHITEQRKQLLKALLDAGFSKDDMQRVMWMAASSPKLNGRSKKSFIPDFDWIFQERNFVRILEGNFNMNV